MSTVAERPLPLRIRPDLVVQPLEFGGRRYFGVKDPVTLRYFQLREEDILEILNKAGMKFGKSELSAILRKKGHDNYRPCGDQVLRYFLKGLTERVQQGQKE